MRWTEEKRCGVKVVSVAMKSPASERLLQHSTLLYLYHQLAPSLLSFRAKQAKRVTGGYSRRGSYANTHTHPHTCLMKFQSFKRDPRDMGCILRQCKYAPVLVNLRYSGNHNSPVSPRLDPATIEQSITLPSPF